MDLEDTHEDNCWDCRYQWINRTLSIFLVNVDDFYKWDKDYIDLPIFPAEHQQARKIHEAFEKVLLQLFILQDQFRWKDILGYSQEAADALVAFDTMVKKSPVPQLGLLKPLDTWPTLTDTQQSDLRLRIFYYAMMNAVINRPIEHLKIN